MNATRTCSYCGSENEDSPERCRKCGTDLSSKCDPPRVNAATMTKRYIGILAVLFPCALLFSFSALFGRADSPEQAITGKVMDWIVLGPCWAGITYIGASAIL